MITNMIDVLLACDNCFGNCENCANDYKEFPKHITKYVNEDINKNGVLSEDANLAFTGVEAIIEAIEKNLYPSDNGILNDKAHVIINAIKYKVKDLEKRLLVAYTSANPDFDKMSKEELISFIKKNKCK